MPNALLVVAQPLILLAGAIAFFPVTVAKLVLAQDWGALTSVRAFQDAWFGAMWKVFAPRVREAHEGRVVPLLRGCVRAGIKVPTAKHAPVHGTVIEVGPGTGNWAGCFADTAAGAKVDRVYGVEPNPDLHAGLLRAVKAAGLQGKYEVVPVGIEDLAKAGIPKGSVDCIATLLCLCSIPEPERNIRELYEYLRPGGQWYVYEHVKSHGPMRLYQCECARASTADTRRAPQPRLATHDGRVRPVPQHRGKAPQGRALVHRRPRAARGRALVRPCPARHGRAHQVSAGRESRCLEPAVKTTQQHVESKNVYIRTAFYLPSHSQQATRSACLSTARGTRRSAPACCGP